MLADAKRSIMKGEAKKLGILAMLLVAKLLTERKLDAYKRGEAHLREVYEPFNFALSGQDVNYITDIVDQFAKDTAYQTDARMLRPLREMHGAGKFTGILSVAYERVIQKTLEAAGHADLFDRIVANTLQEKDGKIIDLTLGVYERKPEVLRAEFFKRLGFREHDTLYLGDTADDQPVADMLPQGNFIVPFLATDDFKQRMADEKKAFVPESEEDLLRYLQLR